MSTERSRLGAAQALPFVLAGALFVTDCTSDHGALSARPHAAGTAGRGGAGGVAGTAGKAHGGASAKGGTGGMVATPPDKHEETPGRSVFTVVHGVVDADLVVWCFARVRDDKTELVGDPVPEGGLAYGASLSFEELPHIDSKNDGVVPYLITGELSLIEGLDCADAVERAGGAKLVPADGPAIFAAAAGEGGLGGQSGEAGQGGERAAAGAAVQGGETNGAGGSGPSNGNAGTSSAGAATEPSPEPPPLRAGVLPGLPPGTLAEGYSVLEVADGCFGAPGFTGEQEHLVCGADYTPSEGSLTAEIAILGRATAAGVVAMQALHASRGSDSIGVRSAPPSTAVQTWVTLVDSFTEGALRPTEPRRDLASTAWGVNERLWTVDVTVNQSPVVSDRWTAIKNRSGIDALEDGRGYTLIVIGPSYDVDGEGFWNPPAFALVDNDPGGD